MRGKHSLRTAGTQWCSEVPRVVFAVLSFLFGLPSTTANADAVNLDQNCSVSILNRNIQANADGSFDMPNVPANMGKVKATATCIRDGETIGAETEYFTVIRDEEADMSGISLLPGIRQT